MYRTPFGNRLRQLHRTDVAVTIGEAGEVLLSYPLKLTIYALDLAAKLGQSDLPLLYFVSYQPGIELLCFVGEDLDCMLQLPRAFPVIMDDRDRQIPNTIGDLFLQSSESFRGLCSN